MTQVHIAYIGLGSNLAEPGQQLKSALQDLIARPEIEHLVASPLYRSDPMGPADQPDYINAVARLETTLSPDALLSLLQQIELAHGRVRDGERWGPRTLDLDLLLYDELIQNEPHLTIPHPGLHERSFVLYPLFDVAPDLILPIHGSLVKLLEQCPATGLEKLANDATTT